MSPTRNALCRWLATKEARGKTIDIGGNVWSMKNKLKSFEGDYGILNEDILDLNETWQFNKIMTQQVIGADNIFCTEVMQFVYNPVTALTNLAGCLGSNYAEDFKDLGKLYLSFHLTHPPMKDHDYLRYTEKGIRKLLDVTGFTVEEFLEPLPGYYLVQCSR